MPDLEVRRAAEAKFRELLPGHKITEYSLSFVQNTIAATEKKDTCGTIDNAYAKLTELGVPKNKIATSAGLLGLPPETLQRRFDFLNNTIGIGSKEIRECVQLLGRDSIALRRNYDFLKDTLRIPARKIAVNPHLIGIPAETLQRRFDFLKDSIGLTESKIATHAHLLGRKPKMLMERFDFLNKKLGVKRDKVANRAELLSMSSKTLHRRYGHHAGLLRTDHTDRSTGRDVISQQAELLGISEQTMQSNIQYLAQFNGLSPNKWPMLLSTTAATKRRKFAFVLREISGYRSAQTIEEKRRSVADARVAVVNNPYLILYSLKRLDSERGKLKAKASA